MGDWFDAAQAQYDAEVPSYLEDDDELCQHDYAACIEDRRDGYGDCCSKCTH
jgi:hypothetical protein